MKYLIHSCCWLLLFFCQSVNGQVQSDPQQAFRQASQSGKPVLLVFSGSDWCMPCIRLEKKVLSDSSFLQFSRTALIILEADFPQRKRLPPVLKAQYEELAASFNTEGAFPKIVLLSAERRLLADLPPYTDQSPDEIIGAIRKALP